MSGKKKAAAPARKQDSLKGYLLPGAVVGAVFPLALLTNWVWGGDSTVIGIMGLLCSVITCVTWILWGRTHHHHTRNLAAVFTGLVLGWLTLATSTGPLIRPMVNTWALGGGALWIMWIVWRSAHFAPQHEALTGGKDLLGGMISSLKGSKIRGSELIPGKSATVNIQLDGGSVTASEVQSQLPKIASAVSMGKDQVKAVAVPGHEDRVQLVFSLLDELAKAVPWGGPSAPGRSVADAPLCHGMREDGRPLAFWLVGDEDGETHRQLSHTKTTGMPGAGKTGTARVLIIDMRYRTDVVPVVIDASGKFRQGFGLIRPILGMAVSHPDDVRQVLLNIVDAIGIRADLLANAVRSDGTTGYEHWEPECWTLHRIPVVFFDLEEATDFLNWDDDVIDAMARKARSVGFHLFVSLQVAVHDNIKPKTRSMFGQTLAHGTNDAGQDRYTLSESTRNAGATPSKWADKSVGSHLAELSGTPEHEWATEARTFSVGRDVQTREVKNLLTTEDQWAVIEPVTAACLSRGLEHTDPVHGYAAEPVPVPEDTAPVENEQEEADVIDPSAPIPMVKNLDQFEFAQPENAPEPWPRELFVREVEKKIDEMDAAGKAEVTTRDFTDIWLASGLRSRDAIYRALDGLADTGRLARVNGRPPWKIRARIKNGAGVG